MEHDAPESDVCLCGSTHWHTLIFARLLWCRRCGALRHLFEGQWWIPLDRAGDMPRPTSPPSIEDDIPTSPGGPKKP